MDNILFGKKTLKQLANKHNKSIRTNRRHLDLCQLRKDVIKARPIVIGMDCSFFSRGYGIIVVRCPSLKQNLYWKVITTENKAVYEEAREYPEQAGFDIRAVVIDAKHGIRKSSQEQ